MESVLLQSRHLQRQRVKPGGGGGDSFMISELETSGSTRNNHNGFVGTKFTASGTFTVSSLGRVKISGNSLTHDVLLLDNASNFPVASAVVDLSTGSAGVYNMVTFAIDITLPAGTYILISRELNGGDEWFEDNAVLTAAGFTLDGSVYSFSPVPIRNDANGKIGFKFHPSSDQSITHVGRFKVFETDTASHTVSIYDSTGTTVLASASVANSGQPMGVVYAALSVPLSVLSGVTYIIASDELLDGDKWIGDVGGPVMASDFVFENSVYNDGTFHDFLTTSVFPVQFKYASGMVGLSAIDLNFSVNSSGKAYVYPNLRFH